MIKAAIQYLFEAGQNEQVDRGARGLSTSSIRDGLGDVPMFAGRAQLNLDK